MIRHHTQKRGDERQKQIQKMRFVNLPKEPSLRNSRRQVSQRRERRVAHISENNKKRLMIQTTQREAPQEQLPPKMQHHSHKAKQSIDQRSPTSAAQDLFGAFTEAVGLSPRQQQNGFKVHSNREAANYVAMPSLDAATTDSGDDETLVSASTGNESELDPELLQEFMVRNKMKQRQGKEDKHTAKLRRDLFNARRRVELERSQKRALQQRLKSLEEQVKQELELFRQEASKQKSISTKSSTKSSSSGNDERLRKLEEELRLCKSSHQAEKERYQTVEKELALTRAENKKVNEKMRLLMFQYLSLIHI